MGGGLILGLALRGGESPVPGTLAGSFQPNAWLQITSDDRVLFHLHKAEMGQGIITSLPVIIGEELDFAPSRFEVVMAGVHPDYRSPLTRTQITGGSTSISDSWDTLRHAGAGARAMLRAAAGHRWGVAVDYCQTRDGVVLNTLTGERLSYGTLAGAAREFSGAPYTLKAPAAYRWIGIQLPHPISVSKSTGTARYGVDTDIEGMKNAVIVRCPHFGGTFKSWQPDSLNSLGGVIAAFPVHSGIAIVADTYWQARQAAGKLRVEWHKGPLAGVGSDEIRKAQEAALQHGQPRIVMSSGDIDGLVPETQHTVSARYRVPYAHHSPMEPQNATAVFYADEAGEHCEVWAPNQAPDVCRAVAAHYGRLSRDRITLHSTLMGGGFGRRVYPDYVGEAVAIARKLPGTPIKLMWSREDCSTITIAPPRCMPWKAASTSGVASSPGGTTWSPPACCAALAPT